MLLLPFSQLLLVSTLIARQVEKKCPKTNEYLVPIPPVCPTCLEPGQVKGPLLTTVPRGQLGNHLHAYALLSSLQTHYPTGQFYLSSSTSAYLSTYFETRHLLLPSLSQVCLCREEQGVKSRPWQWRFWNTDKDKDFVRDIRGIVEEDGTAAWILWPRHGFLYSRGQTGVELLKGNSDKVIRSLVFMQRFLETARETLARSELVWRKRNYKRVRREKIGLGNVTMVGIHHRRGDHLAYERVMGIPHVTLSYLGPSMDLFRERAGDERPTIFLYVSDDQSWVREQRLVSRDKDLVEAWSSHPDTEEATGEDLALLSLCQHTLMTRGTFSHWATLLAGGRYLRPSMFPSSASPGEVRARQGTWPANPLDTRWQISL